MLSVSELILLLARQAAELRVSVLENFQLNQLTGCLAHLAEFELEDESRF